MAMMTEFIAAINQISSERGIDPESVYSALEEAVLVAYKKDYNGGDNIAVELDRESGAFKVVAKKEVVKKVEDKELQISLDQAQKINKVLRVGDSVEIEQPIENFGRIAAQTAKQVILQKIREFEKEAVLSEYESKIGDVLSGMMQRMQGGNVVFEIGKALAFMPQENQIPSEFYKAGERYKLLLEKIEDGPNGRTLLVSRAAPDFLIGLFKMEVPEIESGVVEVKACAREAGSRSKMAVYSNQDGVDPIGSCVGQRGMRIANVMAELGNEKIDIIEWRKDLDEFVEKALSPAQVISVKIDKKTDTALVIVDDSELSLAIGKDGQNVRLAAKLTGLKIDIQGNGSSAKVEKIENAPSEADQGMEEISKVSTAATEQAEETDADQAGKASK